MIVALWFLMCLMITVAGFVMLGIVIKKNWFPSSKVDKNPTPAEPTKLAEIK